MQTPPAIICPPMRYIYIRARDHLPKHDLRHVWSRSQIVRLPSSAKCVIFWFRAAARLRVCPPRRPYTQHSAVFVEQVFDRSLQPPLSSSPAFYTCVLGFAYQDKCRAGGGFAADLGPREQVFALLTLHAMRAWGVGFSGEADGATSPQL